MTNLTEDKFLSFDDLIKSIIWPFLSTTDIINLSMTSKGFEQICVNINSNLILQERSLTVREHGSFINLRTKPINQIKSINRMITLFPNITNLRFDCDDKTTSESFCLEFNHRVYCEFYHHNILSTLYHSKQLQINLLELSLPIKSDLELYGIKLLKNLRKLEIFFSMISDKCLYNQVRYLQDLSSLRLNNCISLSKTFLLYTLEESQFLTTLTELDLQGCDNICGFGRCFKNMSKLTYLNVSNTKMNNEDLKEICLNLNKSLIRLDLNYCRNLALDQFEGNTVSFPLFSKLSQLKILSLRDKDELKTTRLTTHLTNLTSLDLSECESIFTTPYFGLENLKYLSYLKTLNLASCNITSKMIMDEFPYFPHLTTLDLSGFKFGSVRDMGFDSIHKFTSLTSLRMHGCSKQSHVDMRLSFLGKMMNLTYLDISRIGEDMNESELFNLGYLTNLQTLRLENSFEKISHLGFQLICSNLIKLTYLTIQSMRISANGISQHLSKLSCLTSLSLRNCTLKNRDGKAIDNNVINFSLFPISLTCLDVYGLKPPCQSMIVSLFSLQGLKEISIVHWDNSMNDDIMSSLSLSLTKLEKLTLHSRENNITNSGLSKLSSLINLKYLVINDNQFEDSSILQLQQLSERNLKIQVVEYW